MNILLSYIIIITVGLIIGSFLNTVIHRLSNIKTMLLARSTCPHCQKPISPRDLIPLLSYVLLKGRCRSCRHQISWGYPLVELSTALLFAIFLWRFGWNYILVGYLLSLCFLIVIFVYDIKWQMILDRISLPAIVVSIFFSLYRGLTVSDVALGIVVGGGFFLVQFLISDGRWIGGGDVRLGVFIGALLGWQMTLVALVLAYLIASIIGIILLIMKKARRNTKIALGPSLVAGTVITMLFGSELLSLFVRLLG